MATPTREPLPVLARAIAAEAARLEIWDLVFVLDDDAGTVTVKAAGLKSWGPRTMLEGRLHDCGLSVEVWMPDAYMVVKAATGTTSPAGLGQ